MQEDRTGSSRILTLVFTDLADSTALKTERGDVEVGDLISRHRDHVIEIADACAGRIIDWAGDGCFLTFETSSAAVVFALRLQQAHAAESDLPGVRVGMHMGEVTEKPGPGVTVRIEGLAVDVAARISGLAKPGQVLMSSAIYNSARQRLGVDTFGEPILWQAHGTYELKGLDEPLDISEAGLEGCAPLEAPKVGDKGKRIPKTSPKQQRFTIVTIALAVVVVAAFVINYLANNERGPSKTAVDSLEPITSLAVLMLDVRSDGPDDEMLAEGMTDALARELWKIESLRVISHSLSKTFSDPTMSTPQIAKELGAIGLIGGSISRDGDEVYIDVKLVHGPSGVLVWAGSYAKKVTSIYELYAEVALDIADAIEAEVTGEERKRIADVQAVDPEAHDAYIIGHHHLNNITREGLNTAIEHFEEATRIDPEFAHAWGGMICAYVEFPHFGIGEPREYYPKARSAGMRATEIDDDLGRDHSHLGLIHMNYDWEWGNAEERFLHGLSLSPSDPVIHVDYGLYLMYIGRNDEALQHALTALDLKPIAPQVITRQILAQVQLESTPDRTRTTMERLREDEPQFMPVIQTLARAYKYLDMTDEAIAISEFWVDEAGGDAPSTINLALTCADTGQEERARDLISDIEQVEGYFDGSGVAYTYVSLGRLDLAFDWLDRSKDARDRGLLWLRTIPYWKIYIDDPDWIAFRNDPRYWDLIDHMGFPPLPDTHPGYAEDQAWLASKAAK